jgi:hypothetical protein
VEVGRGSVIRNAWNRITVCGGCRRGRVSPRASRSQRTLPIRFFMFQKKAPSGRVKSQPLEAIQTVVPEAVRVSLLLNAPNAGPAGYRTPPPRSIPSLIYLRWVWQVNAYTAAP